MALASTFPVPSASGRRDATACLSESDTDLPHVQRAREGDQAAYRALWEKHWPDLCAYFARRVLSREEAEDLASETLLAAYDQLPSFRGIAASHDSTPALASAPQPSGMARQCTFRTYLYAIAHHKLARWIRQKKTRPCTGFADLSVSAREPDETAVLEEKLGADSDSDPLLSLLKEAYQDEMCYALADVGMRSSEQFKALLFHYCCRLPHKEIAALFDTRSETVNTRLQEGRRTLMRHFHRSETSDRRDVVSC